MEELRKGFREETSATSRFLMGIAASAIAFAFVQTATRQPTTSLGIIAVAVAVWAFSFAAGIAFSHHRAESFRANIAALDHKAHGKAGDAERSFIEANRSLKSSNISHRAQRVTLLCGALLYAAGHGFYLYEPRPATPALSSTVQPAKH